MKKLLVTIALSLLATNVLADSVKLQCWSGYKEIFNKTVRDVLPGDGYLAATTHKNTYIIVGDCVITYKNPIKHKKPHH